MHAYVDICKLKQIAAYIANNEILMYCIRPSQVVFLFLVPSHINFWLCTILAIIGIAHALFCLMLIAKHMASVYRLVKCLVKCLYTCKNCMVGL